MGIELMPWQELVLNDSLAVKPGGELLKRRVGVLVSRQQGKSALMRVRILAGMFLWGESWIGMAQNRKLALDQLNMAADAAKQIPWMKAEIAKHRMSNGDECLELKNGARWNIAAATREGPRGMTGNLWVDELREIEESAWGAATPVTRAVPSSQIWITSNAGDANSIVLNEFRSRALAGADPAVGWYEWSADPGMAINDRRGWIQANPALGYTMDEDVLAQAVATDHPDTFRTESLCQWVEAMAGAFDMEAFRACTQTDLMLGPGLPTWMAIDVTPDRKRADLVVGQQLDGERIAVGVVQSWASSTAVDDRMIASDTAQWARTYNARVVAFDRYAASSIASRLASAGVPVGDVSGASFAQACDETLSAINAKRLVHTGQPELASAVAASVRKAASDGGWRIVRKSSSGYIAAAVGMCMVIHHATQPQRMPEIIVV